MDKLQCLLPKERRKFGVRNSFKGNKAALNATLESLEGEWSRG
jgi:hypothetical protein